jgi:hypothetical protein
MGHYDLLFLGLMELSFGFFFYHDLSGEEGRIWIEC